MAKLNFPDPAVTQTYTEAGITWTWNATLGVWSSEAVAGGDQYLSKVSDDTAAGEITFEGLTTHEAGVKVTGGDQTSVEDGMFAGPETGGPVIVTNGGDVTISMDRGTATERWKAIEINIGDNFLGRADVGSVYGLELKHPSTLATSRADQIYLGLVSTVGITSSVDTAYAFFGDCATSTGVTNKAAVYLSNASNTNARAWNFYAAGSAPNFYAGDVRIGNTFSEPGLDNTETGLCLQKNGDGVTLFGSRNSNIAFCFNRNTSGTVGQYRLGGSVRGEVVASSGGCNWNSRAGFSTRAEIPEFTDASQLISQLKAGRDGFAAEDIQSYMPGDWVYESEGEVMFDNTRLIPVLTKALQEALARIEQLEADHATLMSNNGGSY